MNDLGTPNLYFDARVSTADQIVQYGYISHFFWEGCHERSLVDALTYEVTTISKKMVDVFSSKLRIIRLTRFIQIQTSSDDFSKK